MDSSKKNENDGTYGHELHDSGEQPEVVQTAYEKRKSSQRLGVQESGGKVGRPTSKTDKRVAVLLDALSHAMPFKRACEFAMIHPSTGYRWMERDKDFATQAAYSTAMAIQGLIKATVEKDPWKVLKNIDSEHFKDRTEMVVTPSAEFLIKSGDREAKLLR